ncbi:MAG: DUF4019 domain-containing protein [Polyangiales bacterium]
MKGTLFVVTLWVAMAGTPVRGEPDASVSNGTAAASAWLALTDSSKFAESWDAASSLFRAAVTRADWVKAVTATRTPLGALRARKLKSATVAHQLPGAPDGDYVIIQYQTVFEHKASAIETVTPMKEKDGTWRVSGYFIK